MNIYFHLVCCNCGFRQQLQLKTNRQILFVSSSQAITCCTVWINMIWETLGRRLRAIRAAVLILWWSSFVCETSALWISLQQLPKAGFPVADLHLTVTVAFLHHVPQLTLGFIVGDARRQRLWRNYSYCQQREAKKVLPTVPHWPGCPSSFYHHLSCTRNRGDTGVYPSYLKFDQISSLSQGLHCFVLWRMSFVPYVDSCWSSATKRMALCFCRCLIHCSLDLSLIIPQSSPVFLVCASVSCVIQVNRFLWTNSFGDIWCCWLEIWK